MKNLALLLLSVSLVLTLTVSLTSCDSAGSGNVSLETELDTISYCLGADIGRGFATMEVELTPEAVAAGIRDYVEGTARFSEDQANNILSAWNQNLRARQQDQAMAESRAEADEFLAQNGVREGVKTTASGLQYEVMQEGKGPKPLLSQAVTVHYKGTLLDGTQFDSSYDRNEPATFNLQGLIPAWQEALPMMNKGAKWKLFVPAELGYGDRGKGNIPPGAALIFEIELLEIGA